MTDITTITEEYLEQIVNQELNDADSWMDAELAGEQAENLKYYYGEPFGNEEEGQSQVVTRDVLETVEGIMPELMKIFTSGDTVVEFDPINPADVPRVEIQGKYINHVFMNRFNGYRLFYDWFKDALLMKNGIIKVGWEKNEECQFRTYEGLTKEELDVIEAEAGLIDEEGRAYEVVEIIDDDSLEDEERFDVRIKIMRQRGAPCIEVIPSEEFRIKERSKSIKDAPFVAHVTKMTVGELLDAGFDEEDIDVGVRGGNDEETTAVPLARFTNPRESSIGSNQIEGSKYEHLVDVAECWIRVYDPEDGVMKMYRTFSAGSKLLEMEEVDRCPMISLSPIMMPHKYAGVAVADLVRDIQEINSTIFRQMLDNLALQNAGRYTAIEGQVNLADLIDNRIGGIIRQKMDGAVRRLDTPDLSQFTVPVLEMLHLHKQDRTGVSRMTHGLDENTLTSHQTASAVNQVMTAAQAKIQLIARNFAETGVKELFVELYNLIREHQTLPDTFPMNGRFAQVNPAEWFERNELHVTVGIGNGNKDQQLFHLTQISNMLQQVGATQFGYLIGAENVFNLAAEFIKNSGYDNPERFISNPASVEPPPPQPNPELIRAEAEAADKQSQIEDRERRFTLDDGKFKWDKKVNAAELSLEATQDRPVGVGTGK